MKKVIVIFSIVIILGISALCALLFSKYALIAGEFFDLKSNDIRIDCKNNPRISLRSLKRFDNLEDISIVNSTPSNYIDLPPMSVKRLGVDWSEFSDSEIFVKFENCECVDCCNSKIHFDGDYKNSISEIYLLYCDIYNLENLNHYESLEELYIQGVYINPKTRSFNTNNSFPVINDNGKLILENTDIFSELDNIKNLTIHQMTIKDIDGILDMDNLREFHVDKGAITEEMRSSLDNKGITIFET